MFLTTPSIRRFLDSTEIQAMCGVINKFGMELFIKQWLLGGGSSVKTSIAAPAIFLSIRALANACSSINPPLLVLMS